MGERAAIDAQVVKASREDVGVVSSGRPIPPDEELCPGTRGNVGGIAVPHIVAINVERKLVARKGYGNVVPGTVAHCGHRIEAVATNIDKQHAAGTVRDQEAECVVRPR